MNSKKLRMGFAGCCLWLSVPCQGLLSAAECPPYTPSNDCCIASEITVGFAGQYPKYIQKFPGSFGGIAAGCGMGCITGGGDNCGGGHNWGCNVSQSGLTSGAVTYTANLQMTPESGCVLPRVSTPVNFSILADAGKPQTSVSFPESYPFVKIEDKVTGEATDDYQLRMVTSVSQYYHYSFLGNLPESDAGGTLYYDRDDLRRASWELPVAAAGQCLGNILQNTTFYVYDSVGHMSETIRQVYVDCSIPTVAIQNPSPFGTGWVEPDNHVVFGTVVEDLGLEKIWLTIKDESANRWWNGSEWQAGIALLSPSEIAGTTTVSWKYDGLISDYMRSGTFTIKAYARDKAGRVGSAEVSGKHKKKYDLGKEDFTEIRMNVKDVKNIGGLAENPYSFTSHYSENTISISAEIFPPRLAGTLSNYVMWDVYGTNGWSGRPKTPYDGNPSTFYVEIPPIIAMPRGRPDPMGYNVFPRIEYDYEDEHREYYSPDHGNITQDNLDTLKQEYIDLGTTYNLPRASFDQDPPAFPGLLGTDGAEPVKHQWHILRFINTKAIALDNAYSGNLNPTSGYRCPIGNKAVGGEYNSNHMLGRAMDYSQGDDEGNWDVWSAGIAMGASENILYDQRNCRILNTAPYFILPFYSSIKCKDVIYNGQEITEFSHGHIAWR